MANAPVKQEKVGMVEIARWAGDYEGKPTISYSLKKKKFNKDTKSFEDSPFFTITDLKDTQIACEMMLLDHYGSKAKPAAPAPAGAAPADDCPF